MTSQRISIPALALASALLGAVALVHCDRGRSLPAEDGAVVDTEVLAFLSLARSHHHEATLLEQTGDAKGAIDALRKITTAPKPHASERVPEVEEVLADAYARMAELELDSKDTASARRDVEAGLLHAPEPTYFRGHLLEVYGIVEQARTGELADAGQIPQAADARTHALTLLREAVNVQEGVIRRVLDSGSGEGGNP